MNVMLWDFQVLFQVPREFHRKSSKVPNFFKQNILQAHVHQ